MYDELTLVEPPPPPSGIDIGRMSDGSKIKVIIGDLAGTIGW